MRPYNCNCFFETKTKQLEKRNEKLLEQNRELVEALTALFNSTYGNYTGQSYNQNSSHIVDKTWGVLLKHSKDV